jgi:predicted ATP-dependent endonuclease of OLD family
MGHLPLLFEFIRRDLHRATETQTAPNETTSIELLSSINVKDYFCLHDIQLANLDQSKEIYFIGENGDGKTILLQSILLALRGNQNQGVVIDFIKQNPFDDMELTATTADQQTYRFETNPKEQTNSYPFVFAYGVNRFRNDSDQKDTEGYLSLFSHEQYLENPVKWLQHLDYREARQLPTPVSLELAKHFLETVLNDNVVIDVNPDRVTFTERGTPLEFEQLSDGYKSVLIWLCDLIARLTESQPNVDALEHYQGIVLIDEIGVFLHPKWQVQIVKKLRSTLKQVQFLFTTHSPTIILGASRDALIYRLYKEEGQTRLSEPIPNQSLSEQMANAVLTAPFLFGLDTARSAAFEQGTDTLDTSDDYLSGIIQRLVTEQLIGKPHINQSELLTLVKKTLADYKANKTA